MERATLITTVCAWHNAVALSPCVSISNTKALVIIENDARHVQYPYSPIICTTCHTTVAASHLIPTTLLTGGRAVTTLSPHTQNWTQLLQKGRQQQYTDDTLALTLHDSTNASPLVPSTPLPPVGCRVRAIQAPYNSNRSFPR